MTTAIGSRSKPLISVMITVFNCEQYLAEAIESVLAQTYRPLELIVIDDGSTDASGEIARSYGESLRYEHRENAGFGAARNRAVELASGHLLAFLDADDRFLPEKLDLQWEALAADSELDAVYGHAREFVSPELSTDQRASLRAPFQPSPWPTPNLMLIRREAFLSVGPFSQTLKVGVGVDWYARSIETGLRSLMLPEIVLERRLHLSNNGVRERDSRWQYLHVLKASLDRRRALESDPDAITPHRDV